MKHTLLLSAFAIGSACAEIRDWTSADGTRTFKGEVTAFDKATNTVKVSVDGQEVSFTTDKLSEKDRSYLSAWSLESPPKATQTIFQLLEADKLHRLAKNVFAEVKLEKNPQYFLLYYSASW